LSITAVGEAQKPVGKSKRDAKNEFLDFLEILAKI